MDLPWHDHHALRTTLRARCARTADSICRPPALVVILALLLALNGCRSLGRNSDSDPDSTALDTESQASEPDTAELDQEAIALPEALQPLLDDGWYDDGVPPWLASRGQKSRWRNESLEKLIALEASSRPDASPALTGGNPIAATNAAIVLARWNSGEPTEQLAAAIRDSNLRLPLRCAAIEALGLVEQPAAAAALASLLAEFRKDSELKGDRGDSPTCVLHAQLIRAVSRARQVDGSALVEQALSSPAAGVRLEAAMAYAESVDSLPDRFADLTHDDDPRVRATAIWAIGVRRDQRTIELARAALDDSQIEVRAAALHALAMLDSDAARALLIETSSTAPPPVRAAAVGALARAGMFDDAQTAALDPSPAVRLAAARALAEIAGDNKPDEQTVVTALLLTRDTWPEVERQSIASLGSWQLEQAGIVLLDALKCGRHAARFAAARQLAERWSRAVDHSFEAGQIGKLAPVETLFERWLEEFGPAKTSTVETIARLGSPDIDTRRQAAAALAVGATLVPLEPPAIQRMGELVAGETDSGVWRAILVAIGRDSSPTAHQLAYTALASPHAGVRLAACHYLAAHGNAAHAAALMRALGDSDPAVVLAAVRALGSVETLEDHRTLEDLLRSNNPALRREAALGLVRLHVPSGGEALERMLADPDPQERARIARAMGEIGDPVFVPRLIRMLDEPPAVRNVVFDSLPQVAGIDPTLGDDVQSIDDADEKVRRWQLWYRQWQDQTSRP